MRKQRHFYVPISILSIFHFTSTVSITPSPGHISTFSVLLPPFSLSAICCSEPLGMKSGHIQDFQITASSVFRTLNMDMFAWEPRKARLDKQGKVNAWTSGHNDQSQWLQIDLLIPTKITGIITQGAKDFGHVQFVGSYKLAYSNDGEHWKIYQDEKQKKDKVFQGNFDNDTHRKNVIEPPIYARHLRILPWSWYGRITLRSELLGCAAED
uniref:EGF like repeats and discoidin domains 3 n=1 Tax=Ficedula albicollis TaxID=59894 RepID=A0A803V4F6_FICAL